MAEPKHPLKIEDILYMAFDYLKTHEVINVRRVHLSWKLTANSHLIQRANKDQLKAVKLIIGQNESREDYGARVANFFTTTKGIRRLFVEFDISFPHFLTCTNRKTVDKLLKYPLRGLTLRVHRESPIMIGILVTTFFNRISSKLQYLDIVIAPEVSTRGTIHSDIPLSTIHPQLNFPLLGSIVISRDEDSPQDDWSLNASTFFIKNLFGGGFGNATAPVLRKFVMEYLPQFFFRNITLSISNIRPSLWQNITTLEFTGLCQPLNQWSFLALSQALRALSEVGSRLVKLTLAIIAPDFHISVFDVFAGNMDAFFGVQRHTLVSMRISHDIMILYDFRYDAEGNIILPRLWLPLFPFIEEFSLTGRSDIEALAFDLDFGVNPWTTFSLAYSFPLMKVFIFGARGWRHGMNFIAGTRPTEVGINIPRIALDSLVIRDWENMGEYREALQNNFETVSSLTCPISFLRIDNQGDLMWMASVTELHLKNIGEQIAPYLAGFAGLVHLHLEEDFENDWPENYVTFLDNMENLGITTITLRGHQVPTALKDTLATNYHAITVKIDEKKHGWTH